MINIGIISVSDRASSNEYPDEGIPSITNILEEYQKHKGGLEKIFIKKTHLIPDDLNLIKETIIEFVDTYNLNVVITTGGTGPSKRDFTPNATKQVINEELPGFGEFMRSESLKYSSNAILSRQLAGIRKDSLIINLPGNPNSINQILPKIMNQIIHYVEERKK
jgi:molybdopterin adenylyltransferase